MLLALASVASPGRTLQPPEAATALVHANCEDPKDGELEFIHSAPQPIAPTKLTEGAVCMQCVLPQADASAHALWSAAQSPRRPAPPSRSSA